MEYNTQNHWLRLCSSTCIQKTRKHFGKCISFSPQVREETPTILGPFERANLNVFHSHLSAETELVSENGVL
jgi:hypothetical protein